MATMAVRIAGKLGWGGGPLRFFSPTRRSEAAVLKVEERDHAHESVPV
jgi:hypothetical protein